MKITAQVKLLPASAHDADVLAATLRACNRAANAASEVAFAKDLKRRNVLQEAVYHQIKADFDPGAQAAVRTVKKVCDAYATFKANLKAGNYGREGSKRRAKAESKPIAIIDVPEPAVTEPDGFLGVDLGVVNIATTSDGKVMSSRQVNRYRQRKRDLRGKLQKKRTKSAARVLKRQRRKEARYATQRNHIMAKKLVHTAERTSRGIGLEALTGIRQRVTAKKDQRARLHSWAFAQLGAFVEYKAKRAGVAVVHVDPRNTSRQCSECWHTHRSNRVDQARFACRSCGIVVHADHNGSRNIAHRADAVWQRGAVNRPRTL